MPKNYAEIIKDATIRIAYYYKQKLLDKAGKYSVDMYNHIDGKIQRMLDGAGNAEYYLNGDWFGYGGPLPDLDSRTWNKAALPFLLVAQQYMKAKQSRFGVGDDDEQAIDNAVKTLDAKIGKNVQPLKVNPKQKPIDYVKSVADTVEKIVKFYETKLESIRNNITEDRYNKYKIEIEHLRKGANVEDVTFFTYFKWDHADDSGKLASDLYKLDKDFWPEVDKFFNGVKAYAEARHNKLSLDTSEAELNRLIKIINLKIGGGLFLNFKNNLLSPLHYMTRSPINFQPTR